MSEREVRQEARELRQQAREQRRAARRERQASETPAEALAGIVFMLGLAYLAYSGQWWPGILVLLALTALVERVVAARRPAATPPAVTPPAATPPAAAPVAVSYPFERLPSECPKCGAPVRPHEVRWQAAPSGDAAAADCPYCGAKLPLAA